MNHARNEGPGGCVPWEEYERLRWALEEACDRAWTDGPAAMAGLLRDAEKALASPRDLAVRSEPTDPNRTYPNPQED